MAFRPRIACIGEAMVELSRTAGERAAAVSFAGDVLNTAVYLKRLTGERISVDFVSSVGTDALSDEMIAMIAAEQIGADAITRSQTRHPGLYAITTDEEGERSFTYWREQSAARIMFGTGEDADFSRLEDFDVLYFSGITLAILPAEVRDRFLTWLSTWKSRTEGTIAFDSNYRPALWEGETAARDCIRAAWELADIALPSLDDEMALFGDADLDAVLERFAAYPCDQGAIKRGAEGPLPLDGRRVRLHFEPAENVVDTTAAGDSFNGAFLASWLTIGDLETSLAAGHACASLVIGHRGAIVPLESWLPDELG